jgi:hypothetical protein
LETDTESGTQPADAASARRNDEGVMPDVVCMNLQEAQDEIQEHGVFFSKSVDATGKGRKQLWDRNWVVVDQSPTPGEQIGEGEALLEVVKEDEPSICDSDSEPAEPQQAPAAMGEAISTPPSTTATTAPPITTTLSPTTAPTVTTITNAPTTPAPATVPNPPTTIAIVTAAPTTRPPPTVAFLPPVPVSDCDPNYEGACVPVASDVDCASGSGNGPAYVDGPVYVVGSDIYELDRDGDGVACD